MNTNPTNEMANEGTKMANNIGQTLSAGKAQMLKIINEQKEEARKLAGQLKGVTDAGARRALGEYKKQIANLEAAHKKAMQGYVANDTGATFMNGFNQALAGSKKALEDAKKGVKAAKKFGNDVNKVRKKVASSIQIQDTSKAQGQVKGAVIPQEKRFGGRKRRTRRKRRKKGRKSRRKGRKSRRSRRKKRKGRKSRRKKRRTRRRR